MLQAIYLQKRGNEDLCYKLWQKCLRTTASLDDSAGKESLSAFLDVSERGLLPSYLKPVDDELDQYATRLVTDAVTPNSAESLTYASRLLSKPGHFLSARAVAGLVHSITFAFAEKARTLLRETALEDTSLLAPLRLLAGCVDSRPKIVCCKEICEFLPDVFLFAFLFEGAEGAADARKIWRAATSNVHGEEKDKLTESVRELLRDLIADTEVLVPPSTIVAVASNVSTGITFDVLRDLFPSQAELDGTLQDLPSDPPDYALAVMDRLIPPPSLWKMEQEPLQTFDKAGYSEYARIINTLLGIAIQIEGSREITCGCCRILLPCLLLQRML